MTMTSVKDDNRKKQHIIFAEVIQNESIEDESKMEIIQENSERIDELSMHE